LTPTKICFIWEGISLNRIPLISISNDRLVNVYCSLWFLSLKKCVWFISIQHTHIFLCR
jgi:hypothetical protein